MKNILSVHAVMSSPPSRFSGGSRRDFLRVTIRVMPFPIHRLRRMRASEPLRAMVRETRLDPAQFVLPLFVCPGEGVRREIGAMPGNYQMSIDQIIRECAEVESLGI